MASADKPMSLASKLAAIGKEIGAVDKSGKNTQQNYNYIEYGVVAGRIRELFDKYHVIIVPSVDNVQQDEITNKYGGKGYHYILTMTFTLINGEDAEDREVASWAGESADYGDKGINKAETAGTKYFLMRLFNVSEKGEEEADKSTPEMVLTKAIPPKATRHFTTAEIDEAKVRLRTTGSVDELRVEYAKLGALALDKEIIACKDEMKARLEGEKDA